MESQRPLRARLTGGVLLLVFLLLNAAVVLPGIHALWHDDDHPCDESQCVVLAVAQGQFEHPEPTMPPQRPVGDVWEAPLVPPRAPMVSLAGPPPAERAPPV